MHLVQILLPTADNAGAPFPERMFTDVRRELMDLFGGVTVFSQGPAQGFWQGEEGTSRDDIVIFEIMTEAVDESWWKTRRERLEDEFRQDEVIVRVQEIQRL